MSRKRQTKKQNTWEKHMRAFVCTQKKMCENVPAKLILKEPRFVPKKY